jgi:hypothetical protein
METFPILIVVFALLTLLVLILGLVIMARGGKINKKLSNKLMILRVALQGITLLLVIVSLALAMHSA